MSEERLRVIEQIVKRLNKEKKKNESK